MALYEITISKGIIVIGAVDMEFSDSRQVQLNASHMQKYQKDIAETPWRKFRATTKLTRTCFSSLNLY